MIDLEGILTAVNRIVADAEVNANSIRNSNFDLDKFHLNLKERQEYQFQFLLSNLLEDQPELVRPPPERNKQDNLDCDMPLNENNYNCCYQRQQLLRLNPQLWQSD